MPYPGPKVENPHVIPDPTPRPPDYRKKYDQDPAERKKLQQAEMLKNELRQQKVVADTDKLCLLAQEVKNETAQHETGKPTYPQAMKLEEIEKLAKNVKQRMRSE
jgi:HAMP domain-containing protein